MIARKRPVKDGDSTTMLETTTELSKYEFKALSSGIENNVKKERYAVNISDRKGELDIFTNRRTGLVIVEFEFQNEANLIEFEQNSNLNLVDITNVEWFAGGRLAEIDAEILHQKLSSF